MWSLFQTRTQVQRFLRFAIFLILVANTIVRFHLHLNAQLQFKLSFKLAIRREFAQTNMQSAFAIFLLTLVPANTNMLITSAKFRVFHANTVVIFSKTILHHFFAKNSVLLYRVLNQSHTTANMREIFVLNTKNILNRVLQTITSFAILIRLAIWRSKKINVADTIMLVSSALFAQILSILLVLNANIKKLPAPTFMNFRRTKEAFFAATNMLQSLTLTSSVMRANTPMHLRVTKNRLHVRRIHTLLCYFAKTSFHIYFFF